MPSKWKQRLSPRTKHGLGKGRPNSFEDGIGYPCRYEVVWLFRVNHLYVLVVVDEAVDPDTHRLHCSPSTSTPRPP